MAGLGADDLGLLEDAQDADEAAPIGRRQPAPRASADDIAMFGSPGAFAPKSAPAPKIAGTTGGASAEDLAMFGPSSSADDRPEWLTHKGAAAPAKPVAHSLDSLSDDITKGKAALNQPTALESAGSALAQPFVDIGKSALRANDFAARAIAHPIDTLASHPGATFREGMRGVNSNIPLANSFVEAIGGPPEYSAEDAAAAPGASDFGSFAGMDPAGKMVGGIAAKTAEAIVPAVASGIKSLAARAAEHDVARAGDKIFEGGTKRSRGGLERSNDKLEEVLRERPAVRAAAMKGDEELGKVSNIYAKRGADDVADIYKEADARSVKPPAPKEYALSDHDIMEAESVPEAIDTASEPKTARIENPNFPTRVASPDVGATVPAGRARIIPEDGALPGKPMVAGPPHGVAESESLFAGAKEAEAEAAKLTAKAERYGRQADGFVNEELSAKAAKRASNFEIRADEARLRAKSLRTQAEAAKAREALPVEAPIAEATAPAVEPSQTKPGARGADVVSNMNREIARLMDGDNESRAVAKQLEKIRDEFKDVRGDAIVPSQVLRAEQTAYQKKGYGKAMPGEHEKTATIAANEIASKAVGDVVIKHVTGMDYQAAQAAAKADPSSVAGRLFKANRDIEIANRIQTHLAAKVGQKVPTWADRHLKQFLVHGAAGALGHAASAISPTLGEAVHAAHVAATAAPYASRAFDAAAERAAPLAERLGEVSIPAPPIPARSTAIANLVKAGRAGATRAQLQAQAKKDGVDQATAERTIAAFSP